MIPGITAGGILIPAPPVGDPFYTQRSLGLHCDGPNDSVIFTDNSPRPKTPTVVGNAKISTSRFKYGGSAGLFDGSGGLVYPNNADWQFGAGSFTLSAYIYLTNLSVARGIFGRGNSVGVNACLDFYVFTNGALYTNLYLADGTSVIVLISPAGAITLNAWHHVAFVRDGNNLYQYINGISQATASTTQAMRENSLTMVVGALGSGSNSIVGSMDEALIYKGACLFPGGLSFTPPPAPFLNS